MEKKNRDWIGGTQKTVHSWWKNWSGAPSTNKWSSHGALRFTCCLLRRNPALPARFSQSLLPVKAGIYLPSRHVVSEKEGRGTIPCTYVCEHCKLFPVEDSLWWVSANHGEKKKKTKTACGMPYYWRKPNRTANNQIVFLACSALCRNSVALWPGCRAGGNETVRGW